MKGRGLSNQIGLRCGIFFCAIKNFRKVGRVLRNGMRDLTQFFLVAQLISFLYYIPHITYFDKIWSYLLSGVRDKGLCNKNKREKRGDVHDGWEAFFLTATTSFLCLLLFLPFIQCLDLMVIRSKKRKEREEEKKKGFSSLHGDMLRSHRICVKEFM